MPFSADARTAQPKRSRAGRIMERNRLLHLDRDSQGILQIGPALNRPPRSPAESARLFLTDGSEGEVD